MTWNGNAATSDCAAATAAPASPAGASASSTPSNDASAQATGQETPSVDPSATNDSSAGQAQTAPGNAAGAGTYRFRFVMGGKDLTEDRVFVVG